MVGLLEGAMTVFGSAAAGGFEAMGKNAAQQMMEDALARREESHARIRDKYAKKAELRRQTFQAGEAEKERTWREEQAETAFTRGIEQRKVESEEARKDQAQIFEQQLTREIENSKLAAANRDAAKSELIRTHSALVELGMPEKEASASIIASVKADTEHKRQQGYAKTFEDSMKRLDLSGLSHEKKTAQATKEAELIWGPVGGAARSTPKPGAPAPETTSKGRPKLEDVLREIRGAGTPPPDVIRPGGKIGSQPLIPEEQIEQWEKDRARRLLGITEEEPRGLLNRPPYERMDMRLL